MTIRRECTWACGRESRWIVQADDHRDGLAEAVETCGRHLHAAVDVKSARNAPAIVHRISTQLPEGPEMA